MEYGKQEENTLHLSHWWQNFREINRTQWPSHLVCKCYERKQRWLYFFFFTFSLYMLREKAVLIVFLFLHI